jgi:uncharacterized protein YjbI with pentapeptide repeats
VDPTAFDRLTRVLAAASSRRGALTALLGALGAAHLSEPDASARRRKSRRKGHQRDKGKQRKRRARKRKRKTGAGAPAGQCCDRQRCASGSGKNLQRCCFDDRDLTTRNFEGANLSGANFARADLTAANFAGANLDEACFVDANATGTRFGNANRGKAIFCRTETASGFDNSGCDRGTPCCPTCDAAHPCGQGQVCCDGRCIPGNCCDNGEQSTCGVGGFCCNHRCVEGDCCETANCPTEVCQRRACDDHQCVYAPVFAEPGPRCDTICCRDAQGVPVCCDTGVTICQENGTCGCAGNQDCRTSEVCCDENCRSGDCCRDQDCLQELCQDRACQGNVCTYTPVSGEPGPGCDTVCCQNAAGAPRCCPPGATTCDARGLCCAAESINQTCGVGTAAPKCGEVLNNCGQPVDCGGCAERICQTASCSGPDNTCVYTPVFAAQGPLCDERVSPPSICCRDVQGAPTCCPGTQCEANGVCGCPRCPCIGTPNRICSIFGTPCCVGMVCTPISIIAPFITNCQLPCETHQQCIDVFGSRYWCDPDPKDCAFIGKCCQRLPSREIRFSKETWPSDAVQFDALAKLVWARTSRRTTLGTVVRRAWQ